MDTTSIAPGLPPLPTDPKQIPFWLLGAGIVILIRYLERRRIIRKHRKELEEKEEQLNELRGRI